MPQFRLATFSLLTALAAPAFAFDFEEVARRAQKLAAEPYRKPESAVPAELANLSYDEFRNIRFKPDNALWRGTRLPFEIQFLHPGKYYVHPVRIHLVTQHKVQPVRFKADDFDYSQTALDPKKLGDLGFAGFRIHYPLNRPDYKDEVAAFAGASYFRALGAGQRYGLSARGLAIDTAEMSGEEFPRFSEFWIEWPAPESREIVVYALLDSPRAAGAYRFVIHPAEQTVVDVRARLFLREPVAKLGIAAMSSMYYFGENQASVREDYRPEVHDSDGLLIHADTGEWIWRPLINPGRLLVTSFALSNPRGFGLMQRDRLFAHYEDLEARYELRPSLWVEPKGNWGAGRVELVQIPTADETNDNVAAFWVPASPPSPRRPFDLEYTLRWQMKDPAAPPSSWVAQTRRGHGFLRPGKDDSHLLIVDFDGPAVQRRPAAANVEAKVSITENGELIEHQVYRNEVTGGRRMAVNFRRKDKSKPVELRAHLLHDSETVSETWSYIVPPQ